MHLRCDVAIIGAGIAGLSASVLLRNAGIRLICLDSRPYPHNKVGEQIVVYEVGKQEWRATPPPVIARSPLRFETVTFHADSAALDGRLCEHARALGTEHLGPSNRCPHNR